MEHRYCQNSTHVIKKLKRKNNQKALPTPKIFHIYLRIST